MTPPTYRSFTEFYQNSDDTNFPYEHRMGGTCSVQLIRAKQTAIDFIDPPVPELMFVIGLRSNIPFKWDLGDGWTKEQRYKTQDLVLCPAHTAIRHDCGGDHEVLFCSFSAEKVASLLNEGMNLDLSALNPLHGPVFRDDIIHAAILQMWVESGRHDSISNLMIDGLFQTIIAQMLRRTNVKPSVSTDPFNSRVMSRLDDYIEAHCNADLTIAHLAQVAGCSTFHFAHSFKQITGKSPHRYVLERRVARAQEILAVGKLPLAEVADTCGFYDQAHMTRVFKKHVGITPGKYRKEVHG